MHTNFDGRNTHTTNWAKKLFRWLSDAAPLNSHTYTPIPDALNAVRKQAVRAAAVICPYASLCGAQRLPTRGAAEIHDAMNGAGL